MTPDAPTPDAPGPDGADSPDAPDAPDEKLTELAHFVFDLVRAGDDERLTAYLDNGVPVDLTDASGNTLLMLAAYNGQPGTVRLLAGRGADVNRLNDRGQSPLAGAVFKADTEVVRVLLEAGADPAAGTPNALDTARMFQQFALLEELEGKA